MIEEFAVGSVVQEKPNGPEMVVCSLGEGPLGSGTCALCQWVDDSGVRIAMVPIDALSVLRPQRERKRTHALFASSRTSVRSASPGPLHGLLASLRHVLQRGG